MTEGDDRLTVAYTATEDDYVELVRALGRRAHRRAVVLGLVLWAASVGTAVLLSGHGVVQGYAFVFGALLVGLVTVRWRVAPRRYVRRVMLSHPSQLPLTPQELSMGPEGLVYSGVRSHSTLGWGFVTEILETRNLFVLRTAPAAGFAVPKRTFDTPEASAHFARTLRALHAAQGSAPPPVVLEATGDEPFQLRFALEERDYFALSRFALRRSMRPRYTAMALGLLLLAAYACLWPYGLGMGTPGVLAPILAALLIAVGSMAWWWRLLLPIRLRRLMRRHPHRFSAREQQMRVGPRGLVHLTEYGSHHLSWDQIAQVAEDRDHVYLFTADRVAFVVPSRALASPEEFEHFVDQAEAWCASARPPPRQVATRAPKDPTTADNPFQAPEE